jgi:hypothetical protein
VEEEKTPKKSKKGVIPPPVDKPDPMANLRKAIRSTAQVAGVSMSGGDIKALK